VSTQKTKMECSLQGDGVRVYTWALMIWRTGCCPCSMSPPLHIASVCKETAGLLQFDTSVVAEAARTRF